MNFRRLCYETNKRNGVSLRCGVACARSRSFELDDGDVLLLNNGLEVKLSNDSHPEFIQGIARMLGDEEVAGVFIYGNRDAYIHFLKQGEC